MFFRISLYHSLLKIGTFGLRDSCHVERLDSSHTNSQVPVLRIGMKVFTRNNNRLMRVIRGVPMKYRKGDLGVVLKVKGPAAVIRWNDSVEHESPNWRDCVKIVEAPFQQTLDAMRRIENRRSREGHKQVSMSYVVRPQRSILSCTYLTRMIIQFEHLFYQNAIKAREYSNINTRTPTLEHRYQHTSSRWFVSSDRTYLRSTKRKFVPPFVRLWCTVYERWHWLEVKRVLKYYERDRGEGEMFMPLKSTSSSLKLRDYSKSRRDLVDVSLSDATDNVTTPTKTEEEDKTSLQSWNFQTPARKRVDTPPQFKLRQNRTSSRLRWRNFEILNVNPSPYTTTNRVFRHHPRTRTLQRFPRDPWMCFPNSRVDFVSLLCSKSTTTVLQGKTLDRWSKGVLTDTFDRYR